MILHERCYFKRTHYINHLHISDGYHEEFDGTNLHEYIDAHSNIFVKMDIEGYEIPWFLSLAPEHMNKPPVNK